MPEQGLFGYTVQIGDLLHDDATLMLRVGNVLRRRCRSINASATSCFLGMSI
jgi:hypothetical protein